jgi:protein SCO1/2
VGNGNKSSAVKLPETTNRRLITIAIIVPIIAIAGVSIGYALGKKSLPPNSPSGPVDPVNFAVPRHIATIPLLNQYGQRTDLSAFHGRVIVLADFMTSCQEECPITTGALLDVRRSLAAAKLLIKVSIVEVSVDATRDIPSRLLAYSKEFGVPFTLLTGTSKNLAELWKWFGVYYERVKEGTPPDINWQNGKPYTFDIVHTDDVFILGASGRERGVVQANADVDVKIPRALASLLDADGRQDLNNPGFGSWTPAEMLQAVGGVLGYSIKR